MFDGIEVRANENVCVCVCRCISYESERIPMTKYKNLWFVYFVWEMKVCGEICFEWTGKSVNELYK